MAPRAARLVVGIGWLLLAASVGVVAWSGGIPHAPRLFQVSYLVGFAGYFLILYTLCRPGNEKHLGRWSVWLIGIILLRLVLIATQASDDTHRYVWEGRVQNAGFSPYVVAPNDARLTGLRDEDWTRINHSHFPAIYPPLAQLEFRAAAAIRSSAYMVKGLHVLWDVLTVVLLAVALRRRGIAPHFAASYGLCPLVLAAFGIEGHVDSLMLLLTIATILAFDAKHLTLAGIALGSAISAKTIVIVLLPWFFFRSWRVAAVAVVTAVVWYVPFGTTGLDGLANLRRFGEMKAFFSFLDSLHVLDLNSDGGRTVAAMTLGVIALVAAWRIRELTIYGVVTLSAVLLTLPVVHFWYVTWVLVLTPFTFRWVWPITAAAFVAYFEASVRAAHTGTWTMPAWASAFVWLAFLMACTFSFIPRQQGNRDRPAGTIG